MREHFSCKECTWFASNSANYRESHPEYQASSSKHNSIFPKACYQVQTSVPPFMLSRNVSKSARGTLKTVQKKDTQLLEEDRAFLRSAPCSALHLCKNPSWTCTVPDPSLITNLPDKTATPHSFSFLCFIFPVTYYHLTYHTAYLVYFIVCFPS